MDSSDLDQLTRTLVDSAKRAFQRRAVLVSGDAEWCRDKAVRIGEGSALESRVWVGPAAPPGFALLPPKQAKRLLGRECDLLIFDALEGFDPDAFGAVAGALRGGGLMLLLLPEAGSVSSNAGRSLFVQRLWQVLLADPALVQLRQNQPAVIPVAAVSAISPTFSAPSATTSRCLTEDQARAVEALLHVVSGHRRRPLVLTSDRGRGKSSALGLAAAELIKAGRKVLVTAPARSAVDPLFERVELAFPTACRRGNQLVWEHASQTGELLYCAPDQLLQSLPTADLLLVDEAAAIPSPILERLLCCYSRIAFATTEHGYEGTGRGFAVRFREVLNRRTPNWQSMRLQQPIRWSAGDPLERLVFRCLLLDAQPAEEHAVVAADPARVELAWIDKARLLAEPRLLEQLFGLLVVAHYRTSPSDLRDLLNAAYLRVLVARWQGQVVGAVLVGEEGGVGDEAAWQVWAGERRLPGHLVPQSLAGHGGFVQAAVQKALRVIRIAVHPALRQQGLGRLMLAKVAATAEREGIDYLCSSFGATADLLPFWTGAGYRAVRLGHARDAASGTHSVVVLKPLSAAGTQLFDLARTRFVAQWPDRLGEEFAGLEPSIALLLSGEAVSATGETLQEQDWLDLLAYAYTHRLYESSAPVLRRWARIMLNDGSIQQLDEREAVLVVTKVLQRRDWTAVSEVLAFTGRKQTEQALKAVLRAWLPAVLPASQQALLQRLSSRFNP